VALLTNNVDIALTKLERMEEAIQEMRLILLKITKEEQVGDLVGRSEKRPKGFSGNSAKREVPKKARNTNTEPSTEKVISEAMKLIAKEKMEEEEKKDSEKEKSDKTIDLTGTKDEDKADHNTQVKQWEKSLTETKTEDEGGENPNQDFWFSLAKQEIFKTK